MSSSHSNLQGMVIKNTHVLLPLMYGDMKSIQRVQTLTGPHSDTVHWRSQGGPVQFLMFGGLVMGSQGLA